MGPLVHTNLHDEDVVYYDQEWCAYQPITLFDGER